MRIESVKNLTFTAQLQTTNNVKSLEQKQSLNQGEQIGLAFAGLALFGVVAVGVKKGKVISMNDALKKSGVALKDGVAIVSETGKKFTGTIKRNVKPFGIKKETVQFVDGVVTEQVYHNAFGNELEGKFYKDGVLRITVSVNGQSGKRKVYPIYQYNENGKLESVADCFCAKVDSVFEIMRSKIKEIK